MGWATERGETMTWNSAAEFFAMGGYAQYVWGSVGVSAIALAVELFLLRQRRQGALLRSKHELTLERKGLNESST